jgi:hypothetical protein
MNPFAHFPTKHKHLKKLLVRLEQRVSSRRAAPPERRACGRVLRLQVLKATAVPSVRPRIPGRPAGGAECHRSSRKTEETRAKERQKTRGTDTSGGSGSVSFRDSGLELRRAGPVGAAESESEMPPTIATAEAAEPEAKLVPCLESMQANWEPSPALAAWLVLHALRARRPAHYSPAGPQH